MVIPFDGKLRSGANETMITVITAPIISHINDRHGPNGESGSNFTSAFLDNSRGLGGVAAYVVDHGACAFSWSHDGAPVHTYYYNFRTAIGTGIDEHGRTINFQAIEVIGTPSGEILWVSTMFPKYKMT